MDTQPQVSSQTQAPAWKSGSHKLLFLLAQLLPIVILVPVLYHSPFEGDTFFLTLLISSFVLAVIINVIWSINVQHRQWWKIIIWSLLQIIIVYGFLFVTVISCKFPRLGSKVGVSCNTQ